ncbi:MAG: ATP-binding protein [Cytophagales bacterium]|nr:ATP-binding protein [Cytophagales bacterium]
MKRPNNPFVLTGYYGTSWFCDREKELSALKDHLKNDRNVVIHSWRRMGKTALIRRLFDQLTTDRWEVLYVDLLVTKSLDEAIRAITLGVHEAYGKTSSGFSEQLRKLFSLVGMSIGFDAHSGAPELSFQLKPGAVPARSLEAIGKFLTARKKRVVIALDEFQQVSGYGEEHAEATFRTWMQAFPKIRFIYSGSNRHLMRAIFTEEKRPFYRSSQLIGLNPLDERVYRAFIRTHFRKGKRIFGDALITRLYGWARGQTYAIQLVCNHVYGRGGPITDAVLDEVLSQILDQETPVYANYQKILPGAQWDLMKAVAKEESLKNPMGNEFLTAHRLGAASSVSAALKSLMKKDIITEEEGVYRIHDVLLGRWLDRL